MLVKNKEKESTHESKNLSVSLVSTIAQYQHIQSGGRI
jgi:hypothetical protein